MIAALPLIGRGRVWHHRLRPVAHAFAYPVFFLLLPLRTLRQQPALLPIRRRRLGWISFDDRDHGVGGHDCLDWVEGLLRDYGIDDADGEIWLQTFPRVLGFVFKPVSFWFCQRADGTLRAALAEVNNTFGERHVYLLQPRADGSGLQAQKVFHVSPFCQVEGAYSFRFEGKPIVAGARWSAQVDYADAQGQLLLTSIAGALEPLSVASARHAVLRQPLLTLGVVVRILWQAFQLWRKKVPFHRKPVPPSNWVSS